MYEGYCSCLVCVSVCYHSSGYSIHVLKRAEYYHTYMYMYLHACVTLRSLLFKGTNFCVFCDLEKSAKFKDR